MSYQVLALKERPQQFDEVIGQEHVARTLSNAIGQDRVHHAYLFCGTRGVGKTTTARILAKCLNCVEGPTATPCDECKSCKDIKDGQSVDVYEIDGASNRGINEIRELREGVRYAPSQSDNKIYIIDEVHMLTNEAFNALLKTLEEPPDHAYFIFATTEPQKIPVTILSRCQRFDFKRISQSDIVGHLSRICQEEGIDSEKAALQLIARQADGAMRDALSLLDQVIGFAGDRVDEEEVANILGVANREHLFEISRAVLARDAQMALEALDVVDRYGYDLQQFASELVTHLRDLTVTAAVDDPTGVTDLTESELAEARDQIEVMGASGAQRRQLLHRYFSVMADGAREMTRSPYPKLLFEMTLVRLTDLEPLAGLDLMVDRLEVLEDELDEVEGLMPSHDTAGGAGRSQPAGSQREGSGGERAVQASPKESGSASSRGGDDRGGEAEGADDDDDEEGGAAGAGMEPAPEPEPEIEEPAPQPEVVAEEEPDEEAPSVPDLEHTAPNRPSPPPSEPPEAMATEDEQPDPADDEPIVGNADELTPDEMWERLCEHLKKQGGSAGVKFKHAHPDSFADGAIDVRCEEQYYSFMKRDDQVALIEEAASELFGGEWTASMGIWQKEEESSGPETIADKEEAEYRRREEQLHERIREHEVVEEAREIFDVDDQNVVVEAELRDE